MEYSDGLDFIENIIDVFTPSVSLNTFFDSISDSVDSYISDQKNTGKNFIGGKVYFFLTDDRKEIIIKTQLFYCTIEKNIIKQEFSGKFIFKRIHISDRKKFIDMLDSDGKISVEISEPD